MGDLFAPEHRDQRARGEEWTERDGALASSPGQERDDPAQTPEEDGGSRGDPYVSEPQRSITRPIRPVSLTSPMPSPLGAITAIRRNTPPYANAPIAARERSRA